MKILILGGRGIAGHMMASFLDKIPEYQVLFTTMDPCDTEGIYLNVANPTMLEEVMIKVKPDIVINGISLLSEQAADNKNLAFQLNSLLPHQLAKLAERQGGRLIHISTDCFFSGKKGSYKEKDIRDASSYAQSRILGEVVDSHHLTIRTSIMGPEQKEDGNDLFLRFMRQDRDIQRCKNVLWKGVTTLELAKAVYWMIKNRTTGLYHLETEQSISIYELLMLMREIFETKDNLIKPSVELALDRTLLNARNNVIYKAPGHKEMLLELKHWTENNKLK